MKERDMPFRRRIVIELAILLTLAGGVLLVVGGGRDVEEVWRTEHGRVLRREPRGDALDDYVLLPCSDPSGARVDFVARKPSLLDAARGWFGLGGGARLHRLEATATVVDVGGERWRRFVVGKTTFTADEAMSAVAGK